MEEIAKKSQRPSVSKATVKNHRAMIVWAAWLLDSPAGALHYIKILPQSKSSLKLAMVAARCFHAVNSWLPSVFSNYLVAAQIKVMLRTPVSTPV